MKEQEDGGQTLTETAYRYIFDGITNGRFRAGQSISPDTLSRNLNMSKTPIREALLQLEVENLVFRNGRYYNVIYLDEQEVLELYQLRRILESEAAYYAAKNVNEQVVRDLDAALNAIIEASKEPNPEPIKLADLNGKFHSIIARASGNRYIVQYTTEIRLKLKVIRTTFFSSYDRRFDESKEHKKIFDAIRQAKPDLAKQLTIDHMDKTIKYVKDYVLNKMY